MDYDLIVLLLATGISLTVAAAVALVARVRWIKPVHSLLKNARQLESGQADSPYLSLGAPAMRQLAALLNELNQRNHSQLAHRDRQRRALLAIVDGVSDPILLADSSGNVVTLNPAAETLFGVTRQQAHGQRLASVVNDEQILHATDRLEDQQPHEREIRLQRSGQRLVFQAFVSRSGGGELLLVLRDVSVMAKAMQMKTDFVANASHELRTPLAAIKVSFETLSLAYRDDPKQTEKCMTIIGGQLQRLEEMLADLLDLSAVESADNVSERAMIRTSDLTDFVQQMFASAAAARNLELVTEVADQEFEFPSDRRLLRLILKNLVENSLKFTPAGGTVRVTFDRADAQVRIAVSDTGIGIALQQQSRVFERFYQVSSARGGGGDRGTGLGLAIVKHAVHSMRGTVDLSSEMGKGTTIRCLLPG